MPAGGGVMPAGRQRYLVQWRLDARSPYCNPASMNVFVRIDAAIRAAKKNAEIDGHREWRVFDAHGHCEVWHSRQLGDA